MLWTIVCTKVNYVKSARFGHINVTFVGINTIMEFSLRHYYYYYFSLYTFCTVNITIIESSYD